MSRWVAATIALTVAVVAGEAAAQPATARPAATAAAAPRATRGVVVVGIGDEARADARALARVLYRDAALRPAVSDDEARVLAGDPAAEGAPARVRELAELRASAAASGDAGQRRLLAAIGEETGARGVVTVTRTPGVEGAAARVTARVLDPARAAYAAVTIAREGDPAEWPEGAPAMVSAALPPAPAAAPKPPPPPIKPEKPGPSLDGLLPSEQQRSRFSAPWFLAGLGAVVTAAVTIFVIVETTSSDGETFRLQGRVPP